MTEKFRFLFLAEVKQVSVQFWVVVHGPFPVGVPLVLKIEAQRYLGYGLDLSRSRDVIGHVIILSVVCGFLQVFH